MRRYFLLPFVQMMESAGDRPDAQAEGFTLIELLVVVAIVAILSAIAYPLYTSHVTRVRRVAAQACLSEMAGAMMRYYTLKLSYKDAKIPQITCKTKQHTGRTYDYRFQSPPTAHSYTLEAVARQADSKCSPLTLNQTGKRGPDGCW